MNIEFIKRIEKDLGEDRFKKYLHCFNEKVTHGLSINLKKLSKSSINLQYVIDRFDAKILYKNDNFAYVLYEKDTLEKKGISPGKDPLYHAGLYYIQEPSAAHVLFDIDIKENDKILDLCASPGGKSCMALYNLNIKKNGFLISNEYRIDRAKTLSSNIERMGFDNCIVLSNTSKELLMSFNSYFDKIIVDAPCSGEGMFRKSDEAVKQWSEDLVKSCSIIQKELLDDSYHMLLPGGILIYSTCTFSKEEDEENVLYLLDKYKDLSLIKMEKLYPFETIGEGQFYAYISKKGNCINDCSFPSDIDLKNLKVLRHGLKLYDDINGRKNPSHAITHNDDNDYLKESIELDDDEIIRYLHGEVIRKNVKVDGFCKITYKNLGVGLAKVSKGVIKNHYPKGLRTLY